MRNIVRAAAVLMVAAVIVGCGGGEQQPAKTEAPAQPVFVAQTMTVPAMKVASIAKIGQYGDVGKSVSDLMAIVQTEKLAASGMPFGLYFDNPTKVKPESTRYEVCIQVAPTAKNKADGKTGFAVKDAPEMMVAATEYMGPYDQVAPTYEKLYKWIGENKYEAAGPMIEWYLSDPSKVKPESLMAKIGAVVKPVAPPVDTTKKAEEPKKTEPKAPTKK
ncbi:MAG: GyrI-like domain-containing protein [candidate division WOR-3 bacterium]|nr:GyrI-like domain-containing protein [candidate division WOR-3 bacterium]